MKINREETDQQMLQRLQSMWALEGTGGYGEQLGVVCPYCEHKNNDLVSYVHFREPQYTPGNDNYDAKGVYGIDVRGDVIVLSFYCEEGGHEWVLVLGAHKGGIFCKIILTDDGSQPSFESPIEQAFWDAWTRVGFPLEFDLIPQYEIGNYRVDFAHEKTHTAIELDGHATHSSPDAIAYDRKRQREIEERGWHVIRFGGKEVYLDALAVAKEAYRLLQVHSTLTVKL